MNAGERVIAHRMKIWDKPKNLSVHRRMKEIFFILNFVSHRSLDAHLVRRGVWAGQRARSGCLGANWGCPEKQEYKEGMSAR